MTIKKILENKGILFQKEVKPMASYSPFVIFDKMIYISGQLPIVEDQILYKGKIGVDLDERSAIKAVQISTANLLVVLENSLKKRNLPITKIFVVNIKGYLNTDKNYFNHSKLFNAASELLMNVLGENGNHSRSVIGVNNLPFNSSVEIDGIFGIKIND